MESNNKTLSSERRTPHWLTRRSSICIQVVLAAVFFMAITQLTQTIVTRGLAQLAARTDVATIVGIRSCNEVISTAPVSMTSDNRENINIPACKNADPRSETIDVMAAVPTGQRVTLLVNGAQVRTHEGAAARVTFNDIRLHPGKNLLAVAVGERALAVLPYEGVYSSYHDTPFGFLPILPVGGPISVLMQTSEEGQGRIVGGWQAGGKHFVLVSGPPDVSVDMAEVGYVHGGKSGFAVEPVPALPAGVAALTPDMFRRSTKITRLPTGELNVNAEACLPADSTLVQWAVSGLLTPQEFVSRITSIDFDVASQGPAKPNNATLSMSQSPTCQLITAQLTLPLAAIRLWSRDFLPSPFDTLTLENFGERLRTTQPPASRVAPDTMVFSGPAQLDMHGFVIETDYGVFTAEANATQEHALPPTRPISSRLTAAWVKAEHGLPIWLQALLSGVTAVAPILLLMFVIRRIQPVEPSVAAVRSNVTAGLSVLLMLALGAAAQPLLFQLFFRATNALDIWNILGESRGDLGWYTPEPYAPVALAIALMLVPLLRALQTNERRERSPMTSMVCFSASLFAVLVLFAIAVVQRLPWQYHYVDAASTLLASIGVRPTVEITLPLLLSTVTFAALVSWVPLFWAFNAIAPRAGYRSASVKAGAAAILLPCVSYFVEAVRVRWLPSSSDFSDQPSLLSLLGAAVLPFTLFLILLFAFRAVIATTVPEAQTKRAANLWRTRNLVLVALLLTLPRLGLDRVAVAPGEMGVIDILSIFQSFGLVAAVLLAVILLRAYSPFEPSGDKVGAPLRPFAFGSDELNIVAALFVGYLALWTSGVLATAVAIGIGWLLFMQVILESKPHLPDSLASPELAQALLKHRKEEALFDARTKQIETRYVKVESDLDTLTKERAAIADARKAQDQALGMNAAEAKRRLLEFGPGSTPFSNGLRGAFAGLVFSIVLQLATSIYGDGGPLTSWADLARRALADPVYAIAPTDSTRPISSFSDVTPVATPDILLFLGVIINASFLWVLLGFVFGFSFHRIRGGDGVIKGLVFALGIAVTYALSQLFSPSYDGIRIARVVPVFLFLLLLGVAVFDAASIVRRKLSPTQLGDIYGWRTSVSYASLIGGVAAIEPIFKLVSGLFPEG